MVIMVITAITVIKTNKAKHYIITHFIVYLHDCVSLRSFAAGVASGVASSVAAMQLLYAIVSA